MVIKKKSRTESAIEIIAMLIFVGLIIVIFGAVYNKSNAEYISQSAFCNSTFCASVGYDQGSGNYGDGSECLCWNITEVPRCNRIGNQTYCSGVLATGPTAVWRNINGS
jgi:hypothetical protein